MCPLSNCYLTILSSANPSPLALSLSQHQGLSQRISSLHQVAKYWSLRFSISPSNEYSGLISFRIDWFDLLAVQGTPKSLLQHYKPSIVWQSAFFIIQLSHPYMTILTFIIKVMSLIFNTLSKFTMAFHSRRKHLFIPSLQSLSTVILEPKKIKSFIVSTFLPYFP